MLPDFRRPKPGARSCRGPFRSRGATVVIPVFEDMSGVSTIVLLAWARGKLPGTPEKCHSAERRSQRAGLGHGGVRQPVGSLNRGPRYSQEVVDMPYYYAH